MQVNILSRFPLAATLFCWASTVSAANLIVNGDFEGTTYSQTLVQPSGTVTNTLPDPWTNAAPSDKSNLNVFANGQIGGPYFAESGTHYMAFQSASTNTGQDCLNQIIPTVPGQQYLVSFWVAMTASPGQQFGLAPEWDSGGARETDLGTNAFYFQPNNSAAVPYTFFSFVETASGTSTSFYFHGADATGAVLVDNVSVTAITSAPEPSSLFLCGVGAVGLIAAVRRRRA